MVAYNDFLYRKSQIGNTFGFEPIDIPDCMFDFQKALTEWAILKGRAAIFADCGMGKTLMELVWADNVVRKTNGNVLILTPLAVSSQTIEDSPTLLQTGSLFDSFGDEDEDGCKETLSEDEHEFSAN